MRRDHYWQNSKPIRRVPKKVARGGTSRQNQNRKGRNDYRKDQKETRRAHVCKGSPITLRKRGNGKEINVPDRGESKTYWYQGNANRFVITRHRRGKREKKGVDQIFKKESPEKEARTAIERIASYKTEE